MTNKVYTGTTSIKEHIDSLDALHLNDKPLLESKQTTNQMLAEQGAKMIDDAMIALGEATTPGPRNQSIEIQQLKREAGLS